MSRAAAVTLECLFEDSDEVNSRQPDTRGDVKSGHDLRGLQTYLPPCDSPFLKCYCGGSEAPHFFNLKLLRLCRAENVPDGCHEISTR